MTDTIRPRPGRRYRTRDGSIVRITGFLGRDAEFVILQSAKGSLNEPGETFELDAATGRYLRDRQHPLDLMEDLDGSFVASAILKIEVPLTDISELLEQSKVRVLEVLPCEG